MTAVVHFSVSLDWADLLEDGNSTTRYRLHSSLPVTIDAATSKKEIFNIAVSSRQYRFLNEVLDSVAGRSWCLTNTLLRLCETIEETVDTIHEPYAMYRVDTHEAISVTRHQFQFLANLEMPIVILTGCQHFTLNKSDPDHVIDIVDTTTVISIIYSGICLSHLTDAVSKLSTSC